MLVGKGLAGQLPLDSAVWTPLGSLQTLNLANNQLGGFVPPQLANLTALEDLQLEGNKLVGNLPRSLPGGTLRSLNLADNQISGAVSDPSPNPLGLALSLQAVSWKRCLGVPGQGGDGVNPRGVFPRGGGLELTPKPHFWFQRRGVLKQ